ncbi:uncharacterized protein LOC144749776 isoform X2 [Ciona intestinalis]
MIPVSSLYSRPTIPFNASQVPRPEVAKQWPHLKTIAEELTPFKPNVEVGLLIGSNVPSAIRPRQIVCGNEDEPYAQKSLLGWGIVGVVCKDHSDVRGAVVHRTVSSVCASSKFHLTHQAKEILNPNSVCKILENDFIENDKSNPMSREDKMFVDLLNIHTVRRKDDHYEMPLPLRSAELKLPNNRPLALKRLFQLRRRFIRNPKYYEDYKVFMSRILKDCSETIDDKDLTGQPGRVNYVPHTGVYHPKKPGKIRVVFDCSAQFAGSSLNDHLLQGPDLTNNLVGVLTRFRKEEVALMTDIESMFHQFFVRKQDRDFLRFLWWKDDSFQEILEYRMKVHLFGAKSSPGVANYGLKQAADDGEDIFGQDVAARELNSETISTFLLESNCDWIDFKFNPPHSSHMGGVWERQIRTVRNVLQPLLLQNSQQLDDEALRTVMVEVENVVNSRPLATDLLNDPGAPEPITPNHLLTTKSRVLLLPPGSFQKADLYVRSRWRRVQFLVNQFWSRWRKEFLLSLQPRQKWVQTKNDISVNDVVLLDEPNSPRNKWKMGRVLEIFHSEDKLRDDSPTESH